MFSGSTHGIELGYVKRLFLRIDEKWFHGNASLREILYSNDWLLCIGNEVDTHNQGCPGRCCQLPVAGASMGIVLVCYQEYTLCSSFGCTEYLLSVCINECYD